MPVAQTASLSYRAELIRKALHVMALVLPLGIVLVGRPGAALVLVPLATLGLGLDVARQRVPAFRRLLLGIFRPIMRPSEVPPPGAPIVLNGAVWMCLAAALCAVLFEPVVAACALAILMVGDAAAALVGRRFGRTRYPGSEKSLEGTLAFVAAGALAAWPFAALAEPSLPLGVLMAGTVSAAVLEALPLPLNDNLSVPLLTGALLTVLLAL